MSGTDPEPRGSFLDALKRRTVSSDLQPPVPPALRQATAYAWRLLVIAAALGVVIFLVIQLKLLVVPLLVAILVTALVWPAFSFLLRHRWPKWLAIVVTVLGTIALISGLVWLAVWQITREFGSVQERTVDAVSQFRQDLIDGPLHLASRGATQASEMYARNLLNFVALFVREGQVAFDWDDELLAKTRWQP